MSAIDTAFRVAVAAELLPVLDELRAVRVELEALKQATKPPELLPLSVILSCSKPAALNRLARDAELRALGLRCGKSLLFKKSEVESLLSSRTRAASGLRAVGAVR